MEGKDKITPGLSILCLFSDIMQINESKNQAVSNFWFQPLPKKKSHLKTVFKVSGTGTYLVMGFEPKIRLPNDHWPVVHQTFITLGQGNDSMSFF